MEIITGPDNNKQIQQKKRRKRISLCCTSCRARKVRCDQGKPCSSCVKKRIPEHLCLYEDSPFIPTTENAKDPEEALIVSKEEIKRLKEELEKYKCLAANSTQITKFTGPTIKKFETISIKPDRIVYYGPTCWRSILDSTSEYQYLLEKSKAHVANARREWKIERNLKDIPPDEYKESQNSNPVELLESLANHLPSYSTVRHYIDIYTESYWAYCLPILDSEILIKDFQKLFTKNEKTLKCKIVVKKKSGDYAKIALIVSVVKYVILMINFTLAEGAFDYKDHLLKFVESLLLLSNYRIKATIPALQTLILAYQIKKIHPFAGDGGDGSNVSLIFNEAVSMAIVLGLHRDIDKLYNSKSYLKRKVLKNIWKVLLEHDFNNSFIVGLPLAISEDIVRHNTLTANDPNEGLVILLREASRMVTRESELTVQEAVYVLEKIENFQLADLLNVSNTIRSLKEADNVVNDFSTISKLARQIHAIFLLHVYWQLIAEGSNIDENERENYLNRSLKYGILCCCHLIELLNKLNNFSYLVADDADKTKLYRLVEISTSFLGFAKIMFVKIYTTLCGSEIKRIFIEGKLTKESMNISELIFKVNVTEIEQLDVNDGTSRIVRGFKSPAFLHSLMTLACKHLLTLQTKSFRRVFHFPFCLYGVIGAYKYFGVYLENNLPRDMALLAREMMDNINLELERNGSFIECTNNFGGDTESVASSNQMTTSGGSISTPSVSTPSSDQADEFDFFHFKNDQVNELFKNMLKDDSALFQRLNDFGVDILQAPQENGFDMDSAFEQLYDEMNGALFNNIGSLPLDALQSESTDTGKLSS